MQDSKKLTPIDSATGDAYPGERETVEIDVVSRPDGYYWIAPDGHQEFGPFKSRSEALDDIDRASDESPEPGESLQEAEDEIGMTDWIDPDTHEPAEGRSTPRLASD